MEYKKDAIRNIFNIVTAIIFIEFILGGLGHIFGLPIRKGLFAIGIVFSIFMIYREKIRIEKKFLIPKAILFAVSLPSVHLPTSISVSVLTESLTL